jgi:glucosamine kinase
MRVFLGFDGGGTKTECVLLDEAGRVAARSKSGPSNPTRIGFDNAAKAVEDAAVMALEEARAQRTDVAAICAGLAGTGRPENSARMKELLSSLFPAALVQVLTDLELPLAMMPDGPAIVLVAGTGSAAIGRDAQGKVLRTGGFGRDVSDEGSAYDVGLRAIHGAAQEESVGSVDTLLGRQILLQLGCRTWDEVQQRINADRDAIYPRVFPVVAAAADAGDLAACSLLDDAAERLSALFQSLAAQLGLAASDFALAKTGGMMGRSAYLDNVLANSLAKAAPRARIVSLPLAPAEAAARIALQAAAAKLGSSAQP